MSYSKNIRGETMIEVAVILSIIVVMSTILYANYHDINKKGDVLRTSETLKNELRRAQNYSLNHQSDHGAVPGWGVYVDRHRNNYVVFADKDNNKVYSYPTKILIHGTEWDNGSSFTDSSHDGRTVTMGGNAEQLDNQGKPDDSDGFWSFDGERDYLSVVSDNDYNFQNNDFVIDLWFRSDDANLNKAALFYKWGDNSADQAWNCYKQASTHEIVCTVKDVNDNFYILTSSSTTGAAIWYHLALVRRGNVLALYLDGVQEDIAQISQAVKSTVSDIKIAAYSDGTLLGWRGDIDELRLANGMAYWDGDFSDALPNQKHVADEEGFKTITLPPDIVMRQILKNALPVNQLSIYFSRQDFHAYVDGVVNSNTLITIGDATETIEARGIQIEASGLIKIN
ncbi:MAG: LamG domain-containing protein [bacterium]